MNIVTVFDYNLKDINNQIMLRMFVGGILEHCLNFPYKIWIITSQVDAIDSMYNSSAIRTIRAKNNRYDIPSNMPNIKYKLYNLCHLNFEFIYLDCDMYVNSDLSYLWNRRKDKPFISNMHQRDIEGHTSDKSDFMNSGLQIVSDPDFLNYDKLYELAQQLNFKFDVPGTDQALLDVYCRKIGYNFVHKDIGCEYNSCAGYGLVDVDGEYNFSITYKNKDTEYPVKINHYWNEFKPWVINCPIFKFYKDLI